MDQKAKDILFKTFWSTSGWTENRDIELEKFEYAKSKGLMFDPIEISHDKIISSILDNFKETKKKEIVNGFISSLSSRNLKYRSFLSSFAIGRVIQHHNYSTSNGRSCEVCGLYESSLEKIDLNVLNFEKLKWGGVRLMRLEYIYFDLLQIRKIEFPEPTVEDRTILENLQDLILNSELEERPRQIEKKMRKLIKSNAYEREVILNIFGVCGILETENQKGFFKNYISQEKREIRPVNKTDWSYPVDWWQGKYGINENAWNYYFK